ncbi:MAG TPA: Ig-like domain-containing protein, partial [Candidatus Paceibacterota bacterium]|nr:Ig-like domain-containing protein [Candidatus Paceibacterota bacterium]
MLTNCAGESTAAVPRKSLLPAYWASTECLGSANFLPTSATLSPAQLVNTPPVAIADVIYRLAGSGTKIAIPSLAENDHDGDGDELAVIWFSATTDRGVALTLSNDWIVYTPPTDLDEDDAFTYQISDGRGPPVLGTVQIIVTPDTVPASNLSIVNLGNGSFRLQFGGVPDK